MQQLAKWHHTRPGLLLFAVIELAAAYGLASIAIDRGNLLWYVLTLIFLVGALQNLVKLIGSLLHGRKQSPNV